MEQQLTAFALDIIAVLIIIYCVHAAAKKGFLRTIIQMVAYVAVLMAAAFISRAAAPVLYDRLIEPMIFQNVLPQGETKSNADFISMAPRIHLLAAASGGSAAGSFDISAVDLSGFDLSDLDLSGIDLSSFGIDLESLDMEELLKLFSESADQILPPEVREELLHEIVDATVRPAAISTIATIGFVLLFLLFSMVANMLLGVLGIVNRLPVIGPINAVLGGVVGFLQGMLIVWLAVLLLHSLLQIFPQGWWVITPQALDKSILLQFFLKPGLLKTVLPF